MQLFESKSLSRGKQRRRRVAILLIAILVTGAGLGYRPALKRYHVWKQQRALGRAKEFLAQKDPASARLELEIALIAVPGSPEALRVAAELLDQVGAPQALVLRRRLVESAPDSVPDRVAMAATALRLRDFNAAREALSGIDSARREDPAVLRANIAYALGVENRPLAEALFDRLAALGLQTDDTRVLHAMLLRQHPNPQKSATAKTEIETLAQDPKFRLPLHRALSADAIAAKDFAAAKRYAALVTADPAATFTDRLNEASLFLLVDQQPFESVFARLAAVAAADSATAVEFARWQLVQGKAAEAERWLGGLPPAIAADRRIAGVHAEIAVANKDWDRFGRLLEDGAWGVVSKEVIQLAMAARVLDARGPALRRPAWTEAMAVAGSSLPALDVLLRIARSWQWEEETERVLGAVVSADPTQAWAHTALINLHRQRGDGQKMLAVMTVLKDAAPRSPTYRHDWALLSMLVLPSSTWDAPKETAKELSLAEPTNPSYATAYALALTLNGKAEEARLLMERLSLAERDFPLRAAYMAFVNGHCRRKEDFEKYAMRAEALPLLNEERALIAAGRQALTRPVAPPAGLPKAKSTPSIPAKS